MPYSQQKEKKNQFGSFCLPHTDFKYMRRTRIYARTAPPALPPPPVGLPVRACARCTYRIALLSVSASALDVIDAAPRQSAHGWLGTANPSLLFSLVKVPANSDRHCEQRFWRADTPLPPELGCRTRCPRSTCVRLGGCFSAVRSHARQRLKAPRSHISAAEPLAISTLSNGL